MKSIPHNRTLLVFTIIFLLAGTVQAETIHLKSGQVVEGTIVERTDDAIKIETGVNVPVTYYLDEIESITATPQAEPDQPEIIPTSVAEPEITQPATATSAPPPADSPAPTPIAAAPAPAPVIPAQTRQTTSAPNSISSIITHKIEEKFPLYTTTTTDTSLPPWQAPQLSTDEYLKIQAQRASNIEQEHINGAVFVLIESMTNHWRELKDAHALIREMAERPTGLAVAAII